MNVLEYFHLIGGVIFLSKLGHGQDNVKFFENYKNAIQDHIMTGSEEEWKQCDILSAHSSSHDNTPHFSMDLDKIKILNIKETFASSSCLLVNYQVENKVSLANLIQFGWAAVQYVRLALVLELTSEITLDMITNTTKIPFLIAAKLKENRKQFICPIVGQKMPAFEENMCKPLYGSNKEKTLRVSLLGIPPYFIMTNSGQIEGTDIRLLKILEQNLNFKSEITIPESFLDAELKVLL